MAAHPRMDVLNAVMKAGLVPVFYHADVEVAKQVANACSDGGSYLLEFTNRGDFAPEVFKELSLYLRREQPHVMLGAGSIVDEPTAALYAAYGADFIVGPVLNSGVARFCNRRKIPYMPGCGSASEISEAEELGVEIVKVFPGDSVGGPNFVKSILGPTPWTRIMPTGGVEATQQSIQAWFKAGVSAVGMGSHLIRRELIENGDWKGLARNTSQVLGWIRAARGQGLFTGVEHLGLYPYGDANGEAIARWYGDLFGFKSFEMPTGWFVSGTGQGRIEIMKERLTDRAHVAIEVADFDAAVEHLRGRGIEFETPTLLPANKVVYLKQRDPAGNWVHIIWRR